MHMAEHFHFIGICGTAMGSVAAALREQGHVVSGSDEMAYPPMSDFLAERGVRVSAGFSSANLPQVERLTVVVGNAISRGNPELEDALNRKLLYKSLPEILKERFLQGRHNLVVTGTHGKTTTTSLLAWILETAGFAPGYLIGGLPLNFGQGACLRPSKYFAIEGDEYDTAFFDKRSKFLHYLPELLIVNNIEFDHADIFGSIDEIKLSFRRLVNIVPSGGMILLNADDSNALEIVREARAPIVEVGLGPGAAARISDIEHGPQGSSFTLHGQRFVVAQHGEFNVRNAAMCICAARFYGVPTDAVTRALGTFQGVKRRQEIRGEAGGRLVIDDFGHHPTAIGATLEAIRHRWPERRLWAVFEPRSNTSRRAVFQHALPEALAHAHGVVLAPVARPEQLAAEERLDVGRVVDDLRARGIDAHSEDGVNAIVDRLCSCTRAGDAIVTFSNGGFGDIHNLLLEKLS